MQLNLHEVTDGGAKFICDRFGLTDPILAVRQAVAELFANGRSAVPTRLESLLAKRKIELCAGAVPQGKEALLKPVPGGFHLIVSPRVRTQLQLFDDPLGRFAIAHELIESFFFSHEYDTPVHWAQLSGYRSLATPAALSSSGFEERLCDYGAGLILIPMQKVGEVTKGGTRVPNESSLKRAAVQCSTGLLSMCHRIASYLSVQHSRHAVVAIVKRSPDPNSTNRDVAWRFVPTKKGGGHPVGVDIEATLEHRFYLPTNKSLQGVGLHGLVEWLDGGAKEQPPIGERTSIQARNALLQVRCVDYDARAKSAIIWFDLDFS